MSVNSGKGKTFTAVKFLKEQIEENGYILITNLLSLHKNIPNSIYEVDFLKIIELVVNQEGDNKYIIFYDEIFTTLEKSGSLRRDFLSFLSQLRKRKILLISTAQEWLEINITFRRYVRFQVDCNMKSFPFCNLAYCINYVKDGDLLHWDNLENDYVAPIIQTNIFKCNKEIADLYDTMETIGTSGSLLNKTR